MSTALVLGRTFKCVRSIGVQIHAHFVQLLHNENMKRQHSVLFACTEALEAHLNTMEIQRFVEILARKIVF